jgi:hypothetical protein
VTSRQQATSPGCRDGEHSAVGNRHRLSPEFPATARLNFRSSQRVTHTPRRARCGDCGRTQILLPTELTVRRADTTEAIGNALVAKANGAGHRTIAATPDRPASTVRRWLRGARGAHAQWLYQQGVQKVVRKRRDKPAWRRRWKRSTPKE